MKTKKSIAIIFACALALSAASMNVYAVDYGTSGGGGGSSSSSTTTDDTAADDNDSDYVETVVTASDVSAAIANEKDVNVHGDSISLSKTAVSMIARSDKPVTFVNSDTGVKITIDPKSITKIRSINIGLSIEPDDMGLVIDPVMDGEFGFTMDITIPASIIPDSIDKKDAHLFYLGDDGKIDDLGKLKANKNGSLTISISHSSKYLISSGSMEDVSAGAGMSGEGELI